MAGIEVSPQPGSPRHARRLLPLGRLGASLVFGALFCVCATLGFVWLAGAVFADRFIALDTGLILWAHAHWGPVLDQAMLFFTTMGEAPVLALLVILFALALRHYGRWIDAAGLVVAGAGAGILNQVLKATYQRVRPDLVEGPFHLTSYSFPSGHAMGAIACYGMLAFIGVRLLRRQLHKLALAASMAALVLAIGCSRVYFGVHFPTDVLGGFVAGAIWLVITIGIMQTAEWYVGRRSP